jgi:hypothetical protein
LGHRRFFEPPTAVGYLDVWTTGVAETRYSDSALDWTIVLNTDKKAGEEAVGRLRLDIRALALLYDSDAELRQVIQRSLVHSQDEYTTRFVALLSAARPSKEGGNLPVALAEIVLASFLTIVGLAAFVPVLAGVSTPQQWLAYLSSAVSAPTSGPLYYGIPVLDFAFAAILLLGAFYSLRRAAKNLKSAGMMVEPGRS